MKKLLFLLLALAIVLCLASCDWFETKPDDEHEHTWEYVKYETGHYKQYTCGCQSPDILGEHCDNNGDYVCDECGYLMISLDVDIEWQYSETHHWWLPEPEGEVMIDIVCGYGEHEDRDNDFFCDICGYNIYPLIPPDNYFLRDQLGYEWLNEITVDDIREIKMIAGGGGPLPPVSFTYISSSTDKSVIANIFESYYFLNSIPVSEEETQIPDGGYFVVQFMLNDGTDRKVHFINGEFYCDKKGYYFEIASLPVFRDGTNFVNCYGFEIWDNECGVYLSDGLLVAVIPTVELEFIELTDDIELGEREATHYIEMNGERIYFLSEYYFYINDDRNTYYQLIGKNLFQLIAENAILYD